MQYDAGTIVTCDLTEHKIMFVCDCGAIHICQNLPCNDVSNKNRPYIQDFAMLFDENDKQATLQNYISDFKTIYIGKCGNENILVAFKPDDFKRKNVKIYQCIHEWQKMGMRVDMDEIESLHLLYRKFVYMAKGVIIRKYKFVLCLDEPDITEYLENYIKNINYDDNNFHNFNCHGYNVYFQRDLGFTFTLYNAVKYFVCVYNVQVEYGLHKHSDNVTKYEYFTDIQILE